MNERSNLPAPPPNAADMHAALDKLGVVARVQALLTEGKDVARVTDLTCWVQYGEGAEDNDVFVHASFTEHPSRGAEATRPFPKRAMFDVRFGAPFGTVLDDPLPEAVVKGIYDVAAYHRG